MKKYLINALVVKHNLLAKSCFSFISYQSYLFFLYQESHLYSIHLDTSNCHVNQLMMIFPSLAGPIVYHSSNPPSMTVAYKWSI